MTVTEDGDTIRADSIGGLELVLRCECGEIVAANSEKGLVRAARRHFREAHPALGQMHAPTILAMAEKKEKAK